MVSELNQGLGNEIVITYLLLIGGLLLVAGLLLGCLKLLKKDVSSPWRTYCGWLVMAPLFLGCVIGGRELTIIGVGLLAFAGFREFARATGLYRDWGMTGVVYLAILALTVISFIPDPKTSALGWYGLFMTLPVYVVGLILLIPIVRNRTRGQLQTVALAVLGFVYFGWMFSHLGFLANARFTYGYLLYLVFAVELNDVAAFTFGKLFGKHRLRSEISPNKTLEGSLGALLVSLSLPWLLSFSFPHFRPVHLILTGLVVGVGGQLGDLSISVIKRDLGIKDMGATIPGHGGVLDRIDSLIFVAPLFFHMVRWFHGLY